ncbi:MAG: Calx-beta domain-containing protein [Thiohalomonadales bacterium]
MLKKLFFLLNISMTTILLFACSSAADNELPKTNFPTIGFSTINTTENSVDNVFSITFEISRASNSPVSFHYSSVDGSALANLDYAPIDGNVTFAAGETAKKIEITILDDLIDEPKENLKLILSEIKNATTSTPELLITIEDNDPPPDVLFDNINIVEADSETTTGNILVKLSLPSGHTFDLVYSTSDDSALENVDYFPKSGTIKFLAGETEQAIEVSVPGDLNIELNKSFNVNFEKSEFVNLTKTFAKVTIADNDGEPNIIIDDISISEGDVGTTTVAVKLRLSKSSPRTISIDYTTSEGSAVAGQDFSITSDKLIFLPGDTEEYINLSISADATYEENETFSIALSAPVNAILARNIANITILNDDSPPNIVVSPQSFNESDGIASFLVNIVPTSGLDTTVSYTTQSGSASQGVDYQATPGDLVIPAGTTVGEIQFTINEDNIDEPDETFLINFTSLQNAQTSTVTHDVTIKDNDNPPSISIDDITILEGDTGLTEVFFTVSATVESAFSMSVQYQYKNGTAIVDEDFQTASGLLTFSPGITTQKIFVKVVGDKKYESAESFVIGLSRPQFATLVTSTGQLTIRNDDSPPLVNFEKAAISITEDIGIYKAKIFLDVISGVDAVIPFQLTGTATIGTDYKSMSSAANLIIPAGNLFNTVDILLIDDASIESSETISINLGASTDAVIGLNAIHLMTISDRNREINDTGFITCADEVSNILPCPLVASPNQDAEHGRDANPATNSNTDGHAGFSFTKISATGDYLASSSAQWSCTKDNVTGLFWEKKSKQGLQNISNSYTWYNSNTELNGGTVGMLNGGSCIGSDCDTQAYIAAINQLKLCGFSDWRLPQAMEINGILMLDPSVNQFGPGAEFFPNVLTITSGMWTAQPTYATTGFFGDSVHYAAYRSVEMRNKDNPANVILVRGGVINITEDVVPVLGQSCKLINTAASTPTSRFTLNGATVIDTRTNLEWARCVTGQAWLSTSSTCSGAQTDYTWSGALTEVVVANTNVFLGKTGWRLPNAKELVSIVENQCENPAINAFVFPNTPISGGHTWTSTPSSTVNFANIVDFSNGSTAGIQISATTKTHMRLVRNIGP